MVLLFSFCKETQAQQLNNLPKGYYINSKGEKIKGFFDLEFVRQNNIKFSEVDKTLSSKKLPIENVEKVVLEKENGDSIVILTQNLVFNGVKERIYIQSLLKGEVNLYQGFSAKENEIFFINSTNLPGIRRINKSDPKSFLSVYFKDCDKEKWRIENVYYNATSLTTMIRQLSNCFSTDNQTLVSGSTVSYEFKKAFSVGVNANAGIFNPSFSSDYVDKIFKANSFSGGYGLNLECSLSNRISFSIGFNTSYNRITTTDSIEQWKRGVSNYTRFSFKALQTIKYQKTEFTPIEFKYRLLRQNQKFVPIFSLGLSYNKLSHTTLEGEFSKTYSTYVLPYPGTPAGDPPAAPSVDKLIGKRGYSCFATAALQKNINKDFTLRAGVKYSYSKESIYKTDGISEGLYFDKVHHFDGFGQLLYTFGK